MIPSEYPNRDVSTVSWRKSSRSSGNNECVEVARLADHVGIRDSKDPDGPALIVTSAAWKRLAADLGNV